MNFARLKVADVANVTDGWWISIRQGKTEAAVRDMPVHDAAAHVLAKRCKSADGFVFTGLIPGRSRQEALLERIEGVRTLHAQPSARRLNSGRSTNSATRSSRQWKRLKFPRAPRSSS